MKIFNSAQSLKQYQYYYYFNYKPRFNGVFSRNNLPRIKDQAFIINLEDKDSKWTHWVSLFVDINSLVYFDSFGVEELNTLPKKY